MAMCALIAMTMDHRARLSALEAKSDVFAETIQVLADAHASTQRMELGVERELLSAQVTALGTDLAAVKEEVALALAQRADFVTTRDTLTEKVKALENDRADFETVRATLTEKVRTVLAAMREEATLAKARCAGLEVARDTLEEKAQVFGLGLAAVQEVAALAKAQRALLEDSRDSFGEGSGLGV